MGYNKLKNQDLELFEALFSLFTRISISEEIILRATNLRQQKSMSVGDCIIAATSLVHNLPLVTRNIEDYKKIKGLEIINPFSVN